MADKKKPAPSWQKGYVESQNKIKAELASNVLSIRTMAKRLGVTTATIKSVAKKVGITRDDWTEAEFSDVEYGYIKRVVIAMNNAKLN
jgi:IS30 family transposase